MVRFSIVIPLYNKANCICDTLQSVLTQTYDHYEIIVVDDGSSDNSVAVVAKLPEFSAAMAGGQARLIRKPNGGVCSARNRGIREARYDYVAFLDADDLWAPDFLEEMVRLINDFPEAYLYSSNYGETINGKMIRDVSTGLPKGFRGIVSDYFEMPARVSDLVCSSSAIVRKEVFKEVGGFDERIRYAEDTDMWWRIIARHPFAFFDKYLAFYRFDAENRAQTTYRRLDAFLPYFIDKYQDPLFRSNGVFYRWANRWAAVHIRRYFFSGKKEELQVARQAADKLDFTVIPKKYRFLFSLPYPIAWALYKLDRLYHQEKE